MTETTEEKEICSWAVIELMGHVTIAGKVTRPGEYGGLWQVNVPDETTSGGYRTEFFGSQSVYRIRMVSEEIARCYARPGNDIIEYNAPIITREEHESYMQRAREEVERLRYRVEVLQDRLTKITALPSGEQEKIEDETNR